MSDGKKGVYPVLGSAVAAHDEAELELGRPDARALHISDPESSYERVTRWYRLAYRYDLEGSMLDEFVNLLLLGPVPRLPADGGGCVRVRFPSGVLSGAFGSVVREDQAVLDDTVANLMRGCRLHSRRSFPVLDH